MITIEKWMFQNVERYHVDAFIDGGTIFIPQIKNQPSFLRPNFFIFYFFFFQNLLLYTFVILNRFGQGPRERRPPLTQIMT